MKIQSIDNQYNNFTGLLTIKKQTHTLYDNIYRIKPIKNQKLQEITLNTTHIESVESMTNSKAIPALRDNVIINMLNGIKYKITGITKNGVFTEKYNKAHLNNSEEILYL